MFHSTSELVLYTDLVLLSCRAAAVVFIINESIGYFLDETISHREVGNWDMSGISKKVM